MHPYKKLTRVINGKRYTIGKSVLIADDEYWDGTSWDRNGHNTFLYSTRDGDFYRVDLTRGGDEQIIIKPLTRDEAKQLYKELVRQLYKELVRSIPK